ncbi:hypothetical protein Q5425_06150 [Amycolatopsis sp. A133]|uniref:hypothetical protein n=1 Tax=Amycolatopsis sp. A133 TaxID=3064472 RepID=UPI0027F26D87|nr:hypothetical protein [Amycolatopsis sp. A133]MDQ7803303.1 hypothetical protein [Amycolatopsis sp. A133]
MSQSPESIEELRARLAGLEGPARVEPLGNLAQKLFQRVASTPLDSPSARADLDEAIRCAEEVYRHHRAGDPQRPQVAAFLGYLLGFRDLQIQGASTRSQAISLLEEAIADGKFPVSSLAALRVLLAMLLITDSQNRLTSMVSLSAIDMMAGRRSPAATPDIDRAEELLRTVRATPGVSTDVSDMADLMSQMCELMKMMLGLGTKPMDLSALGSMFGRFTDLQNRFQAGGTGIFGIMRMALEPGAGVLDVPREEFPVLIMEDSEQEADAPGEPLPAAPEPRPERPGLLRSLLELLALDQDGRSAWAATARLLEPGSEVPGVETVDEAVALASEVVESDEVTLSEEETALAQFVYAATLCLRQRTDPDGDSTDCVLGAEALLSAVRALPAGHPEVPVVLRSLGAFLTAERPLAALDAVAAGFTGRFDAVLAGENLAADLKAELHALRCACRAAFAGAELRRAVEDLPGSYPWPVSLKAAASPPA